ncbi:H/ACA ribonucleoprotein complex subunit GAR1 [[Eubacterium] cellulosolvens]
MLRIGKVMHLSNSQHLIAKMDGANPPALGSRTFSDRLKFIGSINDIFGPTSSPYISIRPFIESPLNMVGTTVYTNDVKRR